MEEEEGGTIIYSMLKSPSLLDKKPHVDSKKVKGGFQIRSTIQERDLIDVEIREVGQHCYVAEVDTTYKLVGGIQNIHWEAILQNTQFEYITPPSNGDGTLNV